MVVFVVRARQQRNGANAEFTQFAAGRQLGAYRLEVDVPAACQGLAPEQGFVEVHEAAAAPVFDGLDEVYRLRFEGWSPVRDTHGLIFLC